MSTQCKIHCHNCNNNYYVYSRSVQRNIIANCPYCNARMDYTIWNMLIDTIFSIDDINNRFQKHHSEQGEDLFSVSIKSIDVPPEKIKNS